MRPALAPLAALLAACAGVPERGAAPPPPPADAAARCARGFAEGCRALGRAHLSGDGVPPDDRLAAALLAQACEMGDPAACADLGVCYAIGRGLAQSDARAAALSRRACEQGSALACSNHGALLAEGAAPARGPGDDRGARIVRLFRTGCDAGVPEGCANLGTALEAGRLALRDVGGAARAFRKACDAGFALACHRLALLAAERSEVAAELTPWILEARACAAAVAPACAAVERQAPATGARTPAAHLVEDRRSFALGIPGLGGFSPAELAAVRRGERRRTLEDVRRPTEAIAAAVPEALRRRLGLDLPPRPGDAGDPVVERLVAARRHQLGLCHEAPRARREAAEGWAVFFVDGDGRPLAVRAATAPADAPLEACLAEVVSGWEFPASPLGVAGPFLALARYEAAPAAAPEYAGPGALRPAPADPACLDRELRLPPEYDGSTGSVTVKLAVDPAGAPALLHALTPAPEAVVAAIGDAVRRCRWSPGADAKGRPAALWLTLSVRLDAGR